MESIEQLTSATETTGAETGDGSETSRISDGGS